MTKNVGKWITSTKCKVCDGTGKMDDPENEGKKIKCWGGCVKGFFIQRGTIST